MSTCCGCIERTREHLNLKMTVPRGQTVRRELTLDMLTHVFYDRKQSRTPLLRLRKFSGVCECLPGSITHNWCGPHPLGLLMVELETVYTNAHHCVQYRFSPVVIGGDHHDELFSGASHGSDVCYLLCLALWFVHCLS